MLTIEDFVEGHIKEGGFLDDYPDYIPPAYVSREKSIDSNPYVRDDIIKVGKAIKKASETGQFEIIVNFNLFNTEESIEVLYHILKENDYWIIDTIESNIKRISWR